MTDLLPKREVPPPPTSVLESRHRAERRSWLRSRTMELLCPFVVAVVGCLVVGWGLCWVMGR